MEGVAMKATLPWAGALAASLFAAAAAPANECCYPSYPYLGFRYYNGPTPYPGYRVTPYPIGRAPDMMGPGFYSQNPYGVWYGPNWNVLPPFPPFQGVLPGKVGHAIEATRYSAFQPQYAPYFTQKNYPGHPSPVNNVFPSHPFARAPRDFFMWRENMEEQNARGGRPALVP
jgi:hypothetical protein